MGEKLCFATFVFGSYDKYIPYYIYSIWKTHPNSFVKIFIETNLESHIYETLKYLNKQGIENFEVIPLKISFDDYKEYKIIGGGGKALRHLIGEEHFRAFDYVYMGDIDILFLPENLSILEFHIKQLSKFGLPFSNKARVDGSGKVSKRLTGLHFFKTKEYFQQIKPIIARIVEDKVYRDKYFDGLQRDEELLYKLNKEAFDFDPDIVSKAERPWHGLHLGITRGNKDMDIRTIKENSSLSLEEINNHLRNYLGDPVFREIQRRVFVVEFEAILKKLKLPYSFSWKYQGFKYRFRRRMYTLRLEI